MSITIKVENVSKAYQIGQFGTGTLSKDIERWFAFLRGKPDPFLKIGEENNRKVKSKTNLVWSLNDLNFEVNRGDAVGIIGKNGAGKSTLLKLLSQVTAPTLGTLKIKGRIASLLEVGTGFHPELTGRENIFLNGAILGMKKNEIKKKFDEIVDFSGVDRYIDTPVKRYSSGMYVRLAFAVAAHLESEILIVDEVLAVGDAEFQKKCLGKMGQIRNGEGRSILFVSHNLSSIQVLCNKGLLLENGSLKYSGNIGETINEYLKVGTNLEINELIENEVSYFVLNEIFINKSTSSTVSTSDRNIFIEGKFQLFQRSALSIEVHIKSNNEFVTSYSSYLKNETKYFEDGVFCFEIKLSLVELLSGQYTISIYFSDPFIKCLCSIEGVTLNIINDSIDSRMNNNMNHWAKAISSGDTSIIKL